MKEKFNIYFGEEEDIKGMLEGNTEQQKEFLEALNSEEEKKHFKVIIDSYNKVRIHF